MTNHQLLIVRRHLRRAASTYERDLRSYPPDDPCRKAIGEAREECEQIITFIDREISR